jgi:hypothetical protein
MAGVTPASVAIPRSEVAATPSREKREMAASSSRGRSSGTDDAGRPGVRGVLEDSLRLATAQY